MNPSFPSQSSVAGQPANVLEVVGNHVFGLGPHMQQADIFLFRPAYVEAVAKASKSIPVYVRQVYGCPKVYAADSEQAQALSQLTGCRTLEHRHTQALEALGFTINVVPDPKAVVLPALR